MKIALKSRGGLLAASPALRAMVHQVDADLLAPADRAELLRLIAAAATMPSKPEASPGSAVEAESHTITIDGASSADGVPPMMRQTEAAMTNEFRELVNWIKRHAR